MDWRDFSYSSKKIIFSYTQKHNTLFVYPTKNKDWLEVVIFHDDRENPRLAYCFVPRKRLVMVGQVLKEKGAAVLGINTKVLISKKRKKRYDNTFCRYLIVATDSRKRSRSRWEMHTETCPTFKRKGFCLDDRFELAWSISLPKSAMKKLLKAIENCGETK